MTISSETPRKSYVGDGVSTLFSFPYRFLKNADLLVILRVTATGVETVQILTTNYTVSGAGGNTGGNVTMLVSPPAGTTLTIINNPARLQDLDLVENDPLPAQELEKKFDAAVLMIQRLYDLIARSVKTSDGYDATFDGTLPATLNAGDLLFINASMNGLSAGPAGKAGNYLAFDLAGIPMASPGSVPGSLTVSAFIATLLDDATSALARATLGFVSGLVQTADVAAAAITYAKIQNVSATSRVLARKTAGAGSAEECTLSDILDFIGSAAQGDILYRGASGWARLGAGTSSQFLKSGGPAANPSWFTAPFSASFTSVNLTITSAGTLTVVHSLGAIPSLVQCRIKCLTAEGGYSIGDEMLIDNQGLANSGFGLSLVTTSTAVVLRYSSSGLVALNKGTGAAFTVTNANWALIVKAWV